MDLNEKETVRFETMPGKQGQMDWGFFEDHLVYEDGKWKKLYCLKYWEKNQTRNTRKIRRFQGKYSIPGYINTTCRSGGIKTK